MAVKAYMILREERDPETPRSLLSLTGPYLFRSEAEQFADVIRTATNKGWHLSVIFIERMLREPVKIDDGWMVTNIWNISSTARGFQGEVVIDRKLHQVQRGDFTEPWKLVGPLEDQRAQAAG